MAITQVERPVLGETDGFRAIATDQAGPGQMNPETIGGLTAALIMHQHDAGLDGPVVIAQDTRPSGKQLRTAAIAAAEYLGTDVIDAGVMPTPAAQKLAQKSGALATVVLSASHNPVEYNGWKGMLGNRKPNKAETEEISRRYWQLADSGSAVPWSQAVTGSEHKISREWYIHQIVDDISREFGEQPLVGKLFVIDGAHGAAKDITPEVFRRLGANVKEFACNNGVINENCGAAQLGGLRDYLQAHPEITERDDFVGALANDGDADRVMGLGVNDHGEIVEISGNHMMEALALNPKQAGIVGTLYTNSGMRNRLKANSVSFEECKNGDKYVTEALLKHQQKGESWARGGEFTGHLIDTNWLASGDGVRTGLWYACYAVKNGKTFGELHSAQPLWPENMDGIKLPEGARINVDESVIIQNAMANVIRLGARPVVRASGTEPLVRSWCEAPDDETKALAAKLLLQSVYEELERMH